MKLIIHASLFASGTIEVDTVTGKTRSLTDPLINADQSIVSSDSGGIRQDAALLAGAASLEQLNVAIGKWILKRSGLDAKVTAPEKEEPVPLVNVVGKGSA